MTANKTALTIVDIVDYCKHVHMWTTTIHETNKTRHVETIYPLKRYQNFGVRCPIALPFHSTLKGVVLPLLALKLEISVAQGNMTILAKCHVSCHAHQWHSAAAQGEPFIWWRAYYLWFFTRRVFSGKVSFSFCTLQIHVVVCPPKTSSSSCAAICCKFGLELVFIGKNRLWDLPVVGFKAPSTIQATQSGKGFLLSLRLPPDFKRYFLFFRFFLAIRSMGTYGFASANCNHKMLEDFCMGPAEVNVYEHA